MLQSSLTLSPLTELVHSVRDAAGQSVKSSISHTFTRDTRDDPFVATKGSYLKLKQVSNAREVW